MSNVEKYNSAFCEVFGVEVSALNDSFSNQTVDSWDSVRQLSVVTALEEAFDIMMEPEDILGFTSYTVGREIVAKYDIIL